MSNPNGFYIPAHLQYVEELSPKIGLTQGNDAKRLGSCTRVPRELRECGQAFGLFGISCILGFRLGS